MKRRIYTVRIYFKDSPNPLELENVWHICTEGGLLRMIVAGISQWWPLINVFRIQELDKKEQEI